MSRLRRGVGARGWYVLALSAVLAGGLPASGAPSVVRTLTVPNQSLVEVRTTSNWDLTKNGNLAVTPLGVTGWSTASVMRPQSNVDTFHSSPLPSVLHVRASTWCAIPSCMTDDYRDALYVKVLRPGTYVVVVIGPPGERTSLCLAGFQGLVRSAGRTLPATQVDTFTGADVAGRQRVIDESYAIVPSRTHTVSGFVYLAAFRAPGYEQFLDCANGTQPVPREAHGPFTCAGFAFVYPLTLTASPGVATAGWMALGSANPASGGAGFGQYYAAVGGLESHAVVLSWVAHLPF